VTVADGSAAGELARLRAENARLERELEEERARSRRAFDTALVGKIVSSFELGRYLSVNQVFVDMCGYAEAEILAYDPYRFWVETTFAEDLEAERAQLQRVMTGEISSYRIEKRYVRKDAEVRWAMTEFSAERDARGSVRCAAINMLDIHDQKTAQAKRAEFEARLRRAQKVETVGRLVGGVAHDFNNRLLVIMGYGQMLKNCVAEDPELSSFAELVLSSAQRAAELTHQLLAYSRQQVLRPRPIDLNVVVDATRRMLERVVSEEIELVTVLGAKHPMLADPGQIEQVLMNLVLNARDAIGGGGRITLETRDAVFTPEQPLEDLGSGDYVALSVVDTGSGISEALRDRIFEPFFTTKESGRGTGLGLSMVEGIVRQSGGAIRLDSTEGHGSTFTVYFPRATANPEAAVETIESGLGRGFPDGELVLVVDDQDDVRALLSDVLQVGRFRVIAAKSGQQALELAAAQASPVALLVTDIVMPGMSGTELADALRVRYPAIKIVFMSGYAERERVRELRPDEQFIAKPFLPAQLFSKVESFLRGSELATAPETAVAEPN
jgi:PAS domain S-box-containing protein